MADKIPLYAPPAIAGEIDKLMEFGATDTIDEANGGTGVSATGRQDMLSKILLPPAGSRGLPLVWDGATNGMTFDVVRPVDIDRHVITARARMGALGYYYEGWPRTPSIFGNAIYDDDITVPDDGPWMIHKFNGTQDDNIGMWCSDYEMLRYDWLPHATLVFKSPGNVNYQRWWFGFFNTRPFAITNPSTNQVFAGFRYDTSALDSTWQCITSSGVDTTSYTKTSTGIAIGLDIRYELAVRVGTASIEFYARREDAGSWDAPVAVHTTNLPAATAFTSVGFAGRCLTASTQSMRVKRLVVTHG